MGKPQSPGPVYMLPPTIGYNKHDASRYRNPMYSLSPRLPLPGPKSQAPGPQYVIRGMTEHGKNSYPAYTIKSRPKPLTCFIVPGPGAYSPEKRPTVSIQRAPAYSIQGRTKFVASSIGPGPAYNLPSMIGPKVPNKTAGAAYTLTGRNFPKDHGLISPGPATYPRVTPNIYKNAPPKYTMSYRWPALRQEQSPGPAAYLPKKLCGEKGPMFSMRARFGENATPYITPEDKLPCADGRVDYNAPK